MSAIEAITFDLWDTIVKDDSDEPERQRLGLKTKYETRRELLWQHLRQVSELSYERVCLAYDVADAAFNRVWHDQHVTWKFEERLAVILDGLKLSLPKDLRQEVIDQTERMEVEIPPKLINGIAETLKNLSVNYKLAVVSDAIVTPGRNLKAMLDNYQLADYFSGFAFSDEVGHSKPHPSMFESAASQLGVPFNRIVHIGDRQHNDIQGSQMLGIRAILFTGARSVDLNNNTADAVCSNYDELPGIVQRLNSNWQIGKMTDDK